MCTETVTEKLTVKKNVSLHFPLPRKTLLISSRKIVSVYTTTVVHNNVGLW